MGAVLYNYGLIFDKTTGDVRLSGLLNLATWDSTQFFGRSINTDPWQGLHVTPFGTIVLPGTRTGEHWYYAQTSPIPFGPDTSGGFARGLAATFSIQQLGDSTVWLSRGPEGDYTVVRVAGYSPQRISTHAVEFDISQIADDVGIEDAIGQVYGEHGHLFYVLTFPAGKRTWVYDATAAAQGLNAWTKRGTWIQADARFTYWRNVFHTFAFGQHLTGDPETNVISRLNHDLHTDVEDRPIRWFRRAPSILDEHQNLVVDRLELRMDVGVGLQTGQGSDPTIMLRISKDGGRTWGNLHTAQVGKPGEYWRRVIFRQLGMGRQWNFEFSGSDPIPWALSGLYVDARRVQRTGRAA